MERDDDLLPLEPQPGLPRAIGILNLLVGGLLLAIGLGVLALAGPTLREYTPLKVEPAFTQEVVDQLRLDVLRELRKAEREAVGPAKAERTREREAFEARASKIGDQVDFAKVNAGLPWFTRYAWVDLLSGPVLNLSLVVGGVGLLRLRPWGRWVSIAVAVLKIARLGLLCVLMVGFVVPRGRAAIDEFAKTDFADGLVHQASGSSGSRPFGATANLKAREMVEVLTAMGYGYAVIQLALGAIYPVIVLVVVNRAGAKAALGEGRARVK